MSQNVASKPTLSLSEPDTGNCLPLDWASSEALSFCVFCFTWKLLGRDREVLDCAKDLAAGDLANEFRAIHHRASSPLILQHGRSDRDDVIPGFVCFHVLRHDFVDVSGTGLLVDVDAIDDRTQAIEFR